MQKSFVLSQNAMAVHDIIVANGATKTDFLMAQTGLSQSSVSRAIQEIEGATYLIMIRDGRSVSYAIGRSIRDLPTKIPLYQIDAEGACSAAGHLIAVRGGGYVVRNHDGHLAIFEGLPWFLKDMLPQGYLGRALCHAEHATLGLSERLLDWSEEESLYAITVHGDDLPGNLLVGDNARRKWASRQKAYPQREIDYDALAEAANTMTTPASSAGGEHPKFLVSGEKPTLVKFSPRHGTALGARWRDLLIAEHVATEVLRAASIAAARTRIIDTQQRCYLVSERFDRWPEGELNTLSSGGRFGTASLASLDHAFVGRGRSWVDSSKALLDLGMLSHDHFDTIRLLHTFGRLIGNTDMHLGNLAFFYDKPNDRPSLSLAPVYDMLPMLYAPERSDIVARTFSPPDISAIPETIQEKASSLAIGYWQALLQRQDLSQDFRQIADHHLALLQDRFPENAPSVLTM